MIGSSVGPYRVTRLLGEGGMGAVYEAVNESIERRVAIKVLKEEFARKPEIVTRFFNEARAVNRVNHPSIVQIHEQGQLPDGTAYIIMELLDGVTLSDRLAEAGGRLSTKGALEVAWQVAAALSAAHAKNIVHRDLKPGNLMLVPDPLGPGGERVKVLDFGIAKLIEGTRGQTASHVVMGTPVYMSPEQCRGAGAVDDKADVYSLGAILFQMLAGRPPFIAEGAGEVIGMHLFHAPPHLRKITPELSKDVADFVDQLLTKDKTQRPGMQDVTSRLSQLAAAAGPAARPDQPTRLKAAAGSQTTDGPRGQQATQRSERSRRTGVLIIGGSLVLGGVILYFGIPSPKDNAARDLAPVGVTSTSPTPTPTPTPEIAPPVAPKPEAVQPASPTPPRPTSAPARPAARPTAPAPSPSVAAPSRPAIAPDVEKQLTEAQRQYVDGHFAKAIELAKSVQRGSPIRAWRIIGSAGCSLGDRKLSEEAYNRLDAPGRQYIKYLCERNGLKLDGETFQPVK